MKDSLEAQQERRTFVRKVTNANMYLPRTRPRPVYIFNPHDAHGTRLYLGTRPVRRQNAPVHATEFAMKEVEVAKAAILRY